MQGFFAITHNRISVLIELLLCLRFRVFVPVRELRVELNRPIGWTHVVLNYIGPNAGIKVYYNGTEVGSDTSVLHPPIHNQLEMVELSWEE